MEGFGISISKLDPLDCPPLFPIKILLIEQRGQQLLQGISEVKLMNGKVSVLF